MPLDTRVNAWRPDLADEALRGRVEAERFAPGRPARVSAAVAPVRGGPSAEATLATEALLGETLRVFEERNGWAWVQLDSDRYVGWMPAETLGEPGAEPTHRVSVARTLLFAGPDIKTPPLATVGLGATFVVRGEAEDSNARYLLIEPEGAIVAQHATPLDALAPDPVAVAEGFLGTPYLWGGKTGLGLDCSALVQVSLQAAGIACPRDSDMQATSLGAALDARAIGALRRGDLIFFPGHVGIMRDPETLLHANAWHMMVACEPLDRALARFALKDIGIRAIRRFDGE